MGTGDGDDPRSPANPSRGWGWGWTPHPRQIGDGTPIPIPGQIGDGDGDGDRGFRALRSATGTPVNDILHLIHHGVATIEAEYPCTLCTGVSGAHFGRLRLLRLLFRIERPTARAAPSL
jgi:hypothetical protein